MFLSGCPQSSAAHRDESGNAISVQGIDGDAVLQSDGTWTLTHSDMSISTYDVRGALQTWIKSVPNGGAVRTVHADGRIEVSLPDGVQVVRTVDPRTLLESVTASHGASAQIAGDGRVIVTRADGLVDILEPSLAVTQTHALASQYRVSYGADGSMEATWYDGSTTLRSISGTLTVTTSDGSLATPQQDGSFRAVSTDGRLVLWDSAGAFVSSTLTIAPGFSETLDARNATRYAVDGVWAEVHNGTAAAGDDSGPLTATLAPDATISITTGDGRWVIVPGERFEHHVTDFFTAAPLGGDIDRVVDWDGTQHLIQADGAVTTMSTDGAISVETRSGGNASVNLDGMFEATLDDGSVSIYDAGGALVRNTRVMGFETAAYQADGVRLWYYLSGVERREAPDTSTVWTIPSPGGGTVTVEVAAGSARALSAHDSVGNSLSVSWSAPAWWSWSQELTDLRVTLADGSSIVLSRNGLWRYVDASGSLLEVRRPDGIAAAAGPGGSFTSTDVQGNPVPTTVNSDGSFSTEGAWGTLTMRAHDAWTWTAANGVVETASSGSLECQVTLPDGPSFTVGTGPWGTTGGWSSESRDRYDTMSFNRWNGQTMDRLVLERDGTYTRIFGSGTTVRVSPDGTRLLTNARGQQWVLAPDQTSVETTQPEGVIRTYRSDGAVIASSVSGARLEQAADGSRTYVLPDGTRFHLTASGIFDGSVDAEGNDLAAQGWRYANTSARGLVTHEQGREVVRTWLRSGQSRSIDSDLVTVEDSGKGFIHTIRPTHEEWELLGGSVVRLTSDGTLTARDSFGSAVAAIRQPDASIELTDARGMEARIGPGLEVTYSFNGLSIHETVSGSELIQDFVAAGGDLTLRANGAAGVSGIDGQGVPVGQGGSSAHQDALGNIVYQDYTGKVEVFPNLRRVFGQLPPLSAGDNLLDDGSRVSTLASGLLEIQRITGQVERRALNGVVEVTTTDGLPHWLLPDGTWISLDAAGYVQHSSYWSEYPIDYQGLRYTATVDDDGRLRTTMADGLVYVLDRTTLEIEIIGRDGDMVRHAADRHAVVLSSALSQPQPILRHANPDGSVAITDGATGDLHIEFAGSPVTTAIRTDGTLQYTSPSGHTSIYGPDGVLMHTTSGGATTDYRRDGRATSVSYASGVVVNLDASGPGRTVFLPNGYWLRFSHAGFEDYDRLNNASMRGFNDLLVYDELDGTVSVYGQFGSRLAGLGSDYTWYEYDQGQLVRGHRPIGDVDVYNAQGEVVQIDHPDGSRSVYQQDGSMRLLSASGNVTGVVLDDVLASQMEDGTWRIHNADGSISIYHEDGTPRERLLADGQGRIVYGPDGSWSQVDADGTVTEFTREGRAVRATHVDGRVDLYTWNADGSVRVHDDVTGTETVLSADGREIRSRTADGIYVIYDADGRKTTEIAPSGVLTRFSYAADGSFIGTRSDGRIDSYSAGGDLARSQNPDGSVTEYSPDGSVASRTSYPNGLLIDRQVSGGTIWSLPDGITIVRIDESVTASDAQGNPLSASLQPDGGVSVTLQAGGREVVAVDGTVTAFDSQDRRLQQLAVDGTLTVFNDFLTIVTNMDGSQTATSSTGFIVWTRSVEGSVTRYNVDGSVAQLAPQSGVLSLVLYDGSAASYDPERDEWTATDPGGSTHVYSAATGALLSLGTATGDVTLYASDGATTNTGSSGTITIRRPDGTLQEVLEVDGTRWLYDALGDVQRVEHPDGTVDSYQNGRKRTTVRPDSSATHYNADGSAWNAAPDGTLVSWELPNGVRMVYLPDGSLDLYARDEETGHRAADGSGWLIQEDGSTLTTDAQGRVVSIVSATGTVAIPQSDGWRLDETDGSWSTFDASGRLLQYAGPDPRFVGITREPNGTLAYEQADGSLRVVDPAGTLLSLRSPDGAAAVQLPDGSWLLEDTDGARSTYDAAGRLLTYTPRQTLQHVQPDGSRVWLQADGAIRTIDADGLLASLVGPDDAVATLMPDGTWQIGLEDGTLATYTAGGRLVRPPEAAEVIVDPDSFVNPLLGDGGWSTLSAEGAVTTWGADGTETRRDADGTVTVTSSEGLVTVVGSDGFSSTRYSDGSQEYARADGTRTRVQVDGSTLWTFGDGSTLQQRQDDTIVVTFADGSQVSRDLNGVMWQKVSSDAPQLELQLSTRLVRPVSNGTDIAFSNDGAVEIVWSDGSALRLRLASVSEFTDADGTTILLAATGARFATQTDGRTVSWPDGSRVFTGLEGTRVVTTADGSTITAPAGGAATVVLSSGSSSVAGADGSITSTRPDGSTITWRADGTRTRTTAIGTVQEWLSDGTSRLVRPDGSITTEDRFGNVSVEAGEQAWTTMANGTRVTFSDGVRREVARDGATVTLYSDGSRLRVSADEKVQSLMLQDGSTIGRSAEGTIVAVPIPDSLQLALDDRGAWRAAAGGQITIWYADGRIETQRTDGSKVISGVDGTRTTTLPDQTIITVHEGLTTETRPDGTSIIQDATGGLTQYNPDGSVVRESADGTVVSFAGRLTTTYATDGTVTRSTGDIDSTLIARSTQVTTFKAQGLKVTTSDAGGAEFELADGSRVKLDEDGWVSLLSSPSSSLLGETNTNLKSLELQTAELLESPDSTSLPEWLATLRFSISLPGGGSLTVGDGQAKIEFANGDRVILYANGDRTEKTGDVETTRYANGNRTQIVGDKKVVFNAQDMSVETYKGAKLVERIDYDGFVTRYDGDDRIEILTTGLTLKNGTNPRFQIKEENGNTSTPPLRIYRTGRGEADSTENLRMLALQRAGALVIEDPPPPPHDPEDPESPDDTPPPVTPTSGSIIINRMSGGVEYFIQGGDPDDPDNPEEPRRVQGFLLLSASTQDGTHPLTYYKFVPGWTQDATQETLRILGHGKATRRIHPTFGDPMFTMKVTLASGATTTIDAAEWLPKENFLGKDTSPPFLSAASIIGDAWVQPDQTRLHISSGAHITPPGRLDSQVAKDVAALAELSPEFSIDFVKGLLNKERNVVRSLVQYLVRYAEQIPVLGELSEVVLGIAEGFVDQLIFDVNSLLDLPQAILTWENLKRSTDAVLRALPYVGNPVQMIIHATRLDEVASATEEAIRKIIGEFDEFRDEMSSPVLKARADRYLKSINDLPTALGNSAGSALSVAKKVILNLMKQADEQVAQEVALRFDDPTSAMAMDAKARQLIGYIEGSVAGFSTMMVTGGSFALGLNGLGEGLSALRALKLGQEALAATKLARTAEAMGAKQPELVAAVEHVTAGAPKGAEAASAVKSVYGQSTARAIEAMEQGAKEAAVERGLSRAEQEAAHLRAQERAAQMPALSEEGCKALGKLEAILGEEATKFLFGKVGRQGYAALVEGLGNLGALQTAATNKFTAIVKRFTSTPPTKESELYKDTLGKLLARLTEAPPSQTAEISQFLADVAKFTEGSQEGFVRMIANLSQDVARQAATTVTFKRGAANIIHDFWHKYNKNLNYYLNEFNYLVDTEGMSRLVNMMNTGNTDGYAGAFRLYAKMMKEYVERKSNLKCLKVELRAGEAPQGIQQIDSLWVDTITNKLVPVHVLQDSKIGRMDMGVCAQIVRYYKQAKAYEGGGQMVGWVQFDFPINYKPRLSKWEKEINRLANEEGLNGQEVWSLLRIKSSIPLPPKIE